MSGPSATAMMTALIRAVHARREPVPLFGDTLGERFVNAAERRVLLERFLLMVGDAERARIGALGDAPEALDEAAAANPAYGGVIARSRWCEDLLLEAVARGVRQYVLVGSGFDTFAFRRPPAAADLQVFELDSEATLACKRERAAGAGLAIDPNLHHLSAVDLAAEGLAAALARTPFSPAEPSFVACMGVLPYLDAEAVRRLLASIAATVAPGSQVAFDYLEPDSVAGPADAEVGRVRETLATAVGEAWRSGLDPAALRDQLAAIGLTLLDDLDAPTLQSRYGTDRALSVPLRYHLCLARVGTP
jgi:methyltransferase (TIGR00027 family)